MNNQQLLNKLMKEELYSCEKSRFLTKYAGSYYFTILSNNQPSGIVQFFFISHSNEINLQSYIPICGMVNGRLINAFEKVAKRFNEEKHHEEL